MRCGLHQGEKDEALKLLKAIHLLAWKDVNLEDIPAAHISTEPWSSSKLCVNSLSPYWEAQVVWPKSWKGHSIPDTEICPLEASLHLTWQGEWIANL